MTEADDYWYWNAPVFTGRFCTPTTKETEEEMKTGQVIDHVFVYGTLLAGQSNHRAFLGSSFRVGPGTTKDRFLMFDCGFPLCRLPNEEDNYYYAGKVAGEVYTVTKEVLAALDRLEGHPNFYERRITDIEEYPRKRIWMYQWANRGGRLPEGVVTPMKPSDVIDWRVHRARLARSA